MWNTIVTTADSLVGRLMLGVLNLSSDHPVLFIGAAAVLLCLTLSVWIDLLGLRLEMVRTMSDSLPERVIKLRR